MNPFSSFEKLKGKTARDVLRETPESDYVALTYEEERVLKARRSRAARVAISWMFVTPLAGGAVYGLLHATGAPPVLSLGAFAATALVTLRSSLQLTKDMNVAANYLSRRGERPTGPVPFLLRDPVSQHRAAERRRADRQNSELPAPFL
jgi:hypothetical protein